MEINEQEFYAQILRHAEYWREQLADSPISLAGMLRELRGYADGYCDAKGWGLDKRDEFLDLIR